MNVSCPRCGKDNPADIRFCLGCGGDMRSRGAGPPSLGGAPSTAQAPRIGPPPPLGGAPPPLGGPPPLGAGPPPLGGPSGLGAPPPLSSGGGVIGPMPPLTPMGGDAAPSPYAMPPVGPPGAAGPPPMLNLPPLIAPPGAAPAALVPPSPLAPPSGFGGPPPLQPPAGGGLGMPPPIVPPGAPPPVGGPGIASAVPPLSGGPPGGGLLGLPPLPQTTPPGGVVAGHAPRMPPPVPPLNSGDPFAASGDPFAASGDPFAASGGYGAPVPAIPGMPPPVPPGMPPPVPAPPSGANPFERASSFVGPAMPPPVAPMAPVGPAAAVGPAMPPPMAPGFNGPASPPGFGTGPRHRQSTEAASAVAGPWAVQPQPGIPPAWPAPAQESPTDVRQALGPGRPRLMVTQLDGTEQGEYPLKEGDNLIGREVGGIFAEDNLLSSKHATIIVQGQQAWVRDEGSRNGVYARIAPRQHIELQDNDQFCIGRIILRFEFRPTAEGVGFLHLVVGRDVDKALFPYVVPQTGMTLGRSRADLKFPKDGWVSGIHCQLMPVAGQVMLVDLKSSNGTFLRIRGLRPLAHGDALLMGQRIFHMQLV